jgi:hypothetical protein
MARIELRPGRTEPLLELLDARDRADYGESGFTARNAPATALYASVGMAVTNRTHVFEKPVRPE